MMRTVEKSALLERADELASLREAAAAARSGDGALRVVAGPPGIGKTALLSAIADEAPVTVLRARAGELEREIPFEVARQLLSRAVDGDPDRGALLSGTAVAAGPALGVADGPSTPDAAAAIHGLFWVVTTMAERQPLLLLVDDAQWADLPSARFLAYLARRIRGLPIALVLATRPSGVAPDVERALQAIGAEPGAEQVTLAPLSRAAAGALFEQQAGGTPDAPAVDALMAETGGNPFLVRAVGAELRGAPPTATSISTVGGSNLHGWVAARLAALPDGATAVARAAATLGDRAELAAVAGVAELDPATTADLIAALADDGLLAPRVPVSFTHALLRDAVTAGMGEAAASLWHRRAAGILADLGADAEVVGRHLLASRPAGDPWVVAALRQAAASSRSRGAPTIAVRYLERALAEPPRDGADRTVLHELGRVQSRVEPAASVQRLVEALALAETPEDRATVLLDLSTAAGTTGDAGAIEALSAHYRLVPAGEALGAQLLPAAVVAFELLVGRGAVPEHALEATRELIASTNPVVSGLSGAALALRSALCGGSAAETLALGRAAIGDEEHHRALAGVGFPLYPALYALAATGDRGVLERFDLAEGIARERGSLLGLTMSAAHRAMSALALGEVRMAHDTAAHAIELAELADLPHLRDVALAVQIEAGLLRGRAAAPPTTSDPAMRTGLGGALLRLAHARALAASGRHETARAALRTLGAELDGNGLRSPVLLPWRADAALVLARLGDHSAAMELADEELTAARTWGRAGPIAAALRVVALTGPAADRVDVLTAAASTLDDTATRLDRASVLVELGAAQRRAGARSAARDVLAEALDLAAACGAGTIGARAREELQASGARPRRDRRWGADALTPSESRVARLAADGRTNREIAQELFITQKTVETHLGRAYGKLGIPGRPALAEALAGT